ncbi:unnamed protein product [Heterobilharzia americana]|nr:unnamed protein product [Heterobilharzia americana]
MTAGSLFPILVIDPVYKDINEYAKDYDYDLYGVPLSKWKLVFNNPHIYLKYYLEKYSILAYFLPIILFALYYILSNLFEFIYLIYRKVKIIQQWRIAKREQYKKCQQRFHLKLPRTHDDFALINYQAYIDWHKVTGRNSKLSTLPVNLPDYECLRFVLDNSWPFLSALKTLEEDVHCYFDPEVIEGKAENTDPYGPQQRRNRLKRLVTQRKARFKVDNYDINSSDSSTGSTEGMKEIDIQALEDQGWIEEYKWRVRMALLQAQRYERRRHYPSVSWQFSANFVEGTEEKKGEMGSQNNTKSDEKVDTNSAKVGANDFDDHMNKRKAYNSRKQRNLFSCQSNITSGSLVAIYDSDENHFKTH